jgi:hypothetical protein
MRKCPQKPSSLPRAGKIRVSLLRTLAIFTIVALLSGLVVIPMAVSTFGLSAPTGFAIGFGGMFALLFLLVAYQLLRMRVQLLLLRNESRDLALARASAGLDGGVLQAGPMTLWVSGPIDWAPVALTQFDNARSRFSALVGEPVAAEHPLRALLFADRDWFLQYARRARLLLPSGLDGFYLAGKPGKIVAGMPNPFKRLAQPDRFLRLLFCYYFLNGYKGFLVHSWLNVGVAGLLAREATADEQARLNRKVLPAVQERRQTLRARELFRKNPRVVFYSRRKRGGQAEFAHLICVVNHAQSLLDYIAGGDAPPARKESFRAFLKELKRRDPYDLVFRRQFGYGLDQLYNNWREWVLAKGIGEHEPPPATIRRALLDHIIPLVADRHAMPEDRLRAIRDMGQAGYTLGADTLIDLLQVRNPELRSAAAWALEMISGTAGGEDIGHWEAWWDRLPQDAEPAAIAENSPPPDSRVYRNES